MKPGTSSPASELTALCEAGLTVLEADRPEVLDDLADRLGRAGQPDDAGSREEIEQALHATRRLMRAVATEASRTAAEIARVRDGRHALRGYRRPKRKAPRAVDLDA